MSTTRFGWLTAFAVCASSAKLCWHWAGSMAKRCSQVDAHVIGLVKLGELEHRFAVLETGTIENLVGEKPAMLDKGAHRSDRKFDQGLAASIW